MHEIRFNDIRGVEQSVDLTQEKFSFAFNADCMDLLRALPDKSVVLACVDPPYGDASSQTVNVERERERDGTTGSAVGSTDTKRWNRFGQRFDRYKHQDMGQIRGRDNLQALSTVPPPNCQNMVNPSSEPEEPGRRSTGKKS